MAMLATLAKRDPWLLMVLTGYGAVYRRLGPARILGTRCLCLLTTTMRAVTGAQCREVVDPVNANSSRL